MACPIPIRIVNPKYKKIVSQSQDPTLTIDAFSGHNDFYIDVPCGRCYNCLKKYRNSWKIRLLHEFQYMTKEQKKNATFVTLTFSDEYLPKNKEECSKLIRKFLERVRKKYKRSFKHWIVSEYGTRRTKRLHLHGIFFDPPFPPWELTKYWKYGNTDSRVLIPERVIYCTGYINKLVRGLDYNLLEDPDKRQWVFSSPGIGKSYTDDPTVQAFSHQHGIPIIFGYQNNKPFALPRYYRQKLFTDDELENLTQSYFLHQSDDVIPPGPYFIGNKEYNDYSLYLRDAEELRKQYYQKYKHLIYGKPCKQPSFDVVRHRLSRD